ncbi:hypothetical protein V6N13_068543 [Hibiscus sabdariffa]
MISLTREEIDDDIFAMTGSKPSGRPKKRAKNVQKQLDCLFPGMWLSSVTPSCYKVPDPPLKNELVEMKGQQMCLVLVPFCLIPDECSDTILSIAEKVESKNQMKMAPGRLAPSSNVVCYQHGYLDDDDDAFSF